MVFFICHIFKKQALILFSFCCTCSTQMMHGLCFYELFSSVKCDKQLYVRNNNVVFSEVPQESASKQTLSTCPLGESNHPQHR